MEKSQQKAPDAALTDFGFRQVPTGQKQALVRDVFDTVAARYDLMPSLPRGHPHSCCMFLHSIHLAVLGDMQL